MGNRLLLYGVIFLLLVISGGAKSASAEVIEVSYICNTCVFVPSSDYVDPIVLFGGFPGYVRSIYFFAENSATTTGVLNVFINECNEDYSICNLHANSNPYSIPPGFQGGISLVFESVVQFDLDANYIWSAHMTGVPDGSFRSGGAETDEYTNGSAIGSANIVDYSFAFEGTFTGEPVMETGSIVFAITVLIFIQGLIAWGFVFSLFYKLPR